MNFHSVRWSAPIIPHGLTHTDPECSLHFRFFSFATGKMNRLCNDVLYLLMRCYFEVGLGLCHHARSRKQSVPRVGDYSPTGLNILAQGRAKRRPGYTPYTTPNALNGQYKQTIVDVSSLFCPFRAAWDVLRLPRAALRDVSSLRSALGYDVAAPFGAYSKFESTQKQNPMLSCSCSVRRTVLVPPPL